MTDGPTPEVLHIKKYANRRFYDTTRSRHVTLGEMHDLIRDGHNLKITDSKTNDDITQIVLTQLILERDPPKLCIFPSNVLHDVIRTQQEFLGTVVEQFFAQVLETHKASQDQWARFLQNTLGIGRSATTPFDWSRSFMDVLMPRGGRNRNGSDERATDSDGPELTTLRRQVADLTRQVEEMARKKK